MRGNTTIQGSPLLLQESLKPLGHCNNVVVFSSKALHWWHSPMVDYSSETRDFFPCSGGLGLDWTLHLMEAVVQFAWITAHYRLLEAHNLSRTVNDRFVRIEISNYILFGIKSMNDTKKNSLIELIVLALGEKPDLSY